MDPTKANVLSLNVTEETLPRYDPSHGTPDPMVRRSLLVTLRDGDARFEQTDYGHPGRFNDWEPRGIDTRLQPRTVDLQALCTALSSLLRR
jgi:hypothetical protein